MNYHDIFLNNQKHDPFKGVGQQVAQFQRPALSNQGKRLCGMSQSCNKQAYPAANLISMSHFVTILSSPDDILSECAEFLEELSMKNFEVDVFHGNVKGYFFQDAKNVMFSLQIRGQDDADLYLDATRMTGDAFVFNDFWKALNTYLGEKGHIEEEIQDEEDNWSFIDFSDDEDGMDLEDSKYLNFNMCSGTVKHMIDDMKDPNFRESRASTLAFNCEDNENRQVLMQYGQELFDALIACIFCSMATCYFVQLPFYRSAAQLLDAVFDNEAVRMVSTEQYETLVAATKNWALQSRHNHGEITCSEEIATILSKQLARCAPPLLTERAQNDLYALNDSPFHTVKQHAQAALGLVEC